MPDQTRGPAPTWQPPPDFEQFGGDLDAASSGATCPPRPTPSRGSAGTAETASHVRTAVSRFGQVSDVSDADRALAFENIRLAASYFDVHVTEKSWPVFMPPPGGRWGPFGPGLLPHPRGRPFTCP